MSLFLFGVVFALVRQADRAAANQAWAWVVMAALIALVAAVGAFFALGAWVALSDPKSRLGSWFQRKMSVADAAEAMGIQICVEGSMWVGFFLIPLGGSYSIIGIALLFCSGLIFFLIMRREFKLDIKALDILTTIHVRQTVFRTSEWLRPASQLSAPSYLLPAPGSLSRVIRYTKLR
jgi:hypothetical protein